jgi:hypothetical protein
MLSNQQDLEIQKENNNEKRRHSDSVVSTNLNKTNKEHVTRTPPGSGRKKLNMYDPQTEPLEILTDEKEIANLGYAPLPAHIEGTSAANIVNLQIWNFGRNRITRVLLKNQTGQLPGDIENYDYQEYLTRPEKNQRLSEAQIEILSGNGEEKRNAAFRAIKKEIIPLEKNSSMMFKFKRKKQNEGDLADFVFVILPLKNKELALFTASSDHILTAGMMPYVIAAGDGFFVDRKDDSTKKVISVNERTGAYCKPKSAVYYEKENGEKINYDDSFLKAVENCFGQGVPRLLGVETPDKHPLKSKENAQPLTPNVTGTSQRNMFIEKSPSKQGINLEPGNPSFDFR